jgi:hypothetical protein
MKNISEKRGKMGLLNVDATYGGLLGLDVCTLAVTTAIIV